MIIICIIFVKRLLFNNEVKESLNKIFKISGIKVLYYDGYIIRLDKCNMHSITPHRIVFSKNDDNLLVLYYDEYHENYDLFFINGQKYTLVDAKKYIRSYFINNKK